MDYQLAAILLVLILLEGVHATLIQKIEVELPNVYNSFGRMRSGYYVFGRFWFSPSYRKFLTSGRYKTALLRHSELVRLANFELILWYGMWLTIAFAVFKLS